MIKDSNFFCSWSGGKDSCLSLYHALQKGGHACFLLTMLTEEGSRSRSHGLPKALIEKQAFSLKIPLITRSATWDDYEREFISALKELERKGIKAGVFGDIDIDDHRRWVERVCAHTAVKPCHPLWKKGRKELLEQFIRKGFKATVISVKGGLMDRQFLGKVLDEDVVREIEKTGVDVSGEQGEFHTVVTDGPVFSFPLELRLGEQYFHDGYWFQDVSV